MAICQARFMAESPRLSAALAQAVASEEPAIFAT